MTRHLDLGCGATPRNPYGSDELHGVDIAASVDPAKRITIRAANLSLEPIPAPDGHFDSVSAYDFFEHVPRVLPTADGTGTRFPFIELMNEVWRVLRPGGLLYAQTPAFPHPAAFQDPTHVNILTDDSHRYFVSERPIARMYGFRGQFALRRSVRRSPRHAYEPVDPGLMGRLQNWNRARRGADSHLIWEFEAIK